MTIAFRPGPLGPAFRQTLPVILGYVPVGFAYGVLAQKSGISDRKSTRLNSSHP